MGWGSERAPETSFSNLPRLALYRGKADPLVGLEGLQGLITQSPSTLPTTPSLSHSCALYPFSLGSTLIHYQYYAFFGEMAQMGFGKLHLVS